LLLLALHFFNDLLGCAHRATGGAGAKARPYGGGNRHGLGLIIDFAVSGGIVVVLTLRRGARHCRRATGPARAEHDLKRRSLSLISNHENVVAGSLQELRQYVPQLARAILAEYTLI
jgi:hypothetical protein